MSLYLAVFIYYCFRESLSLFTCTTHKDSGAYLARFLVVIRNSLQLIMVKIAVCKFKIFAMLPICFVIEMPVYKPEGNKLVRIFWLKNDCFSPGGYGLAVNAHT